MQLCSVALLLVGVALYLVSPRVVTRESVDNLSLATKAFQTIQHLFAGSVRYFTWHPG